jgi:hypothetical protein
MSTIRLFSMAMLLSLGGISSVAYAGSTITDKSYWPNEARVSSQYGVAPSGVLGSRAATTWSGAPRLLEDRPGGSTMQPECRYRQGRDRDFLAPGIDAPHET